jgi:protein-S-isoprenylcysteine O-methyltransferase Ste14
MSTNPSSAEPRGETSAANSIALKAVLQFALIVLLQPAALFIAAGRINWPMGWAYVILFVLLTVASRLVLLRKHPDLAVERSRSMDRKDVKAGDKLLVGVIAIYGPLVTLIVAGLDQRFGWSPHIPAVLPLLALVTAACGILFGTWAMLENRFFSAVVRIQTDRHHTVVTSGPYRFVRHPSYLGAIASHLALPVMLSSLCALIPAALIALAIIIRTAIEDRTLRAGLDGYPEYARRVPYRLLPGAW